MLCLTVAPSITVFAGEGKLKAYIGTEYVDEYLTQLNASLITPANTTITTMNL